MPYYDKEIYLKSSINSVLNQTYKNFELIFVFDDKFKNYIKIKKLIPKDKRIKILLNKKNLGVAKSRNIGIKKSKGKFIAFIDSDDLWKKDKLKTQLNFMSKNNLKFSHTSYDIIDSKGMLLKKIPAGNNYLYFTKKRGHKNPLFNWKSRYWTFLLKLTPTKDITTSGTTKIIANDLRSLRICLKILFAMANVLNTFTT